MIVQLVRHSFPDRPDWLIVDESVPLGTRYEVIGYNRDMTILNATLKEAREIDAYLLAGNGGVGWLPTICFEPIKEEN